MQGHVGRSEPRLPVVGVLPEMVCQFGRPLEQLYAVLRSCLRAEATAVRR